MRIQFMAAAEADEAVKTLPSRCTKNDCSPYVVLTPSTKKYISNEDSQWSKTTDKWSIPDNAKYLGRSLNHTDVFTVPLDTINELEFSELDKA